MMRRLVAALPLLLVACNVPAPKPPPMVAAGEAVSCVDTNRIRETRVQDDRTIDFRMNNGAVYRNTLPQRCPGLGVERAFTYRLTMPRLCSVDVVTVLHSSGGPMRGASCGLGAFVPVRPADPSPASASPARP